MNFLNKVYLMAKNSGTLGFENNVFMENKRGLVYATVREFLTIFIPISGGLQESPHLVL